MRLNGFLSSALGGHETAGSVVPKVGLRGFLQRQPRRER